MNKQSTPVTYSEKGGYVTSNGISAYWGKEVSINVDSAVTNGTEAAAMAMRRIVDEIHHPHYELSLKSLVEGVIYNLFGFDVILTIREEDDRVIVD
jgi:hypothetical protein